MAYADYSVSQALAADIETASQVYAGVTNLGIWKKTIELSITCVFPLLIAVT